MISILLNNSYLSVEGTFMEKDFVFFAPTTDLKYHEQLKDNLYVNGTKVFISWSEIEPEEGQYDWSKIEKYAADYAAAGKKFTLRVSTASFSPNDSPEWLFEDYFVRRIKSDYGLSFEND